MRHKAIEKQKQIACTMKYKVVSYWVAVAPNGEELPIEGKQDWMVDGKEVIGTVQERTEQGKYTDGTYSRDVMVHRSLKVNEQ